MDEKPDNLLTYALLTVIVLLVIGIIPAYAMHGSFVSIKLLTLEESFDRNKDIPIRFIINNKSEEECIRVLSVGVGFAEPIPVLPNGAPTNFTLSDSNNISPLSQKTYIVNIRIHPDMPPSEYTYKVFATVRSCTDPEHQTDYVDGPRFGLKVDPPKSQCIIATATYGSELAPEVQFLRNFRDNTVLSTYSGSNFITLFNAFYYSWSPNVADTIRDNDGLKSISRIMITPLLSILQLGSFAGEHSETGVIASGILSSMLIGAVYVTPVSIGTLSIFRRNVGKYHIKYALITWIAAVVLTIGANILHSDVFMMASAGMLVVSSIALSAIGLTFVINKLFAMKVKSMDQP